MTHIEGLELNWQLDSNEIKSITDDIIKETERRCDDLAAISTKELLTYRNVLEDFNEMERLLSNVYCFVILFGRTSGNKEIRDACCESEDRLNQFQIEIKMRKDLFDILQKYKELVNIDEQLDYESRRYLERTLIQGRQNGLHLDVETRNRVKELKKKIAGLEIEFVKNINDDNPKFPFKKDELNGIPEDLINSLERNENGEYLATFKYSVLYPIMKLCKVPETRRRMYIEFDKRCTETNTPIFEEILELRHQLANTCDYETYSEYILELCMAKNPQNVELFLDYLINKLKPVLEKELAILLQYKKEECEKLNLPFDGKINPSDADYYFNIREDDAFAVDHSKLQEYFPIDSVLNGIFDIYQTLLGLEFQHVPNVVNFHEEAKLYQVRDKETKELMGYFYTDLFPRENKYSHYCVFPIISGCKKLNGKRQIPVCAMVCNFTRPTTEKPALLTHFEVETFLHEFGHVMHQLCAKANFIKFSGTKVESDFLEAPSQMMENWVWEKESLRLISKHYKNGSPIDDEMLNKLIKARKVKVGHYNLREMVFAKIDQIFHQNKKSDTKSIYHDCVKELLLMNIEDENINMVASFQHLVDNYESRYYSYLWSEVYSKDMFETRFKKEGILNSKTGLDYRKCILEPGGSKDGFEMLKNFLGREPNNIAFLHSKGIIDE